MSKFIIGQKNIMTRQFLADGLWIPLTIIEAGPCVVTAVKTKEKHGYNAVQLGFGQAKHIKKPQSLELKDLGKFKYLKEFRVDNPADYKIGQKIDVSQFALGDKVKVTGFGKGRGFAGVVKRHGFSGQPATHGHKDQLRTSGSIGAGGVQHVFKGLRMAGHMGDTQISVINLEVVAIKPEVNQLWVKGVVPGAWHSKLFIFAK